MTALIKQREIIVKLRQNHKTEEIPNKLLPRWLHHTYIEHGDVVTLSEM